MKIYNDPYYPDPDCPMFEVIRKIPYPFSDGRCNNMELVFDLETEYKMACQGHCWYDMNQHVPTMKRFAKKCDKILELGISIGCSTRGLLSGRPKEYVGVDIFPENSNKVDTLRLKKIAEDNNIKFTFCCMDDLDYTFDSTDLLHIDSLHTYDHLYGELNKFSNKVKKYILIHDTELSYLVRAVNDYLNKDSCWEVIENHTYCHGLYVLERKNN